MAKRHCTGEDPNLLMYLHPVTKERLEKRMDGEIQKPCDCDLIFKDEYRSTIYPHQKF